MKSKLSKRLLAIASLIDNDTCLVDIGCDHAYLSIYLSIYKNCSLIASDVNKNALSCAIKNIKAYHVENKVKAILSDGLEKIALDNIDTIVLSGMGTHTILKILDTQKLKYISTLVIQTNNDLYLLRSKVTSMGYYIDEEKVVYDYKYYVVIRFKKGVKKYSQKQLKYGPILIRGNCLYYNYLYQQKLSIYQKLPASNFKKKMLKEELNELQSLIK